MSCQFLHVSLLACSQSQQHAPQQMLLRSVYATYTSHQKHRKPVPPNRVSRKWGSWEPRKEGMGKEKPVHAEEIVEVSHRMVTLSVRNPINTEVSLLPTEC